MQCIAFDEVLQTFRILTDFNLFSSKSFQQTKTKRLKNDTLKDQEDGEAPLVDAEDAIEGSREHKCGEHHLSCVESAGLGEGLLCAWASVSRA